MLIDTSLAQLIKISVATGSDPTLTQGSGGNTSVKTDDGRYMFIKASGTALKNMNTKRGYRRLRIDSVLAILKDKSLARMPARTREPEVVNRLLLACDDNTAPGQRPSVESHLHALLDKCVIHLHPVVIGAYINARNGRTEIEKLFASKKPPPLWVPYAPPGFLLAKKVAKLVTAYEKKYGPKPPVMFLEKHGLFVIAKTPDDAIALTKKIINKCARALPKIKPSPLPRPAPSAIRLAKSAIHKALLQSAGLNTPVAHFLDKNIAAFINRPDAPKLLSTPALGAAELVYANGSPLWLDSPSIEKISTKLKILIAKGRKPPKAFVVKDLGLFVSAPPKYAPVIADVAAGSLMVRAWASNFGGVLPLTLSQQEFITRWENYIA